MPPTSLSPAARLVPAQCRRCTTDTMAAPAWARRALCDDCRALARHEAKARYRESHREKLREAGREYQRRRRTDPDVRRADAEAAAQHRAADPERAREIQRASYWRDPERARAKAKRWRERNREKVRAGFQAWYERNGDRMRAEARARNALARARQHGASGSWTADDFNAKCDEYGGRCAYCGERPDSLTVDHVVPFARGGTNEIDNIVPACSPCNRLKGTQTAVEFLDGRGG